MNRLIAIPPSNVEGYWGEASGLVEAACEYNGGRYSAQDCLKELLSGEKQLWLVVNGETLRAVVITAIMNFPQKKCCAIDVCTGEGLNEWTFLLDTIESWARHLECHQMFFVARPGMTRVLKPLGYTKTHDFLEKDL